MQSIIYTIKKATVGQTIKSIKESQQAHSRNRLNMVHHFFLPSVPPDAPGYTPPFTMALILWL